MVIGPRARLFAQDLPELEVHEIAGLNMVYEDNEVQRRRTALDFIKKLPGFAENFETMTRIAEGFRPELVISDFESFAYFYARSTTCR